VVEHPQLHARRFADVQSFQVLLGLQQAQEMKHAVENAQIIVRRDHYRGLTCDAALADDVAVGGESLEAGIELGDVRFG
jgi:hypothetical protein